MNNIQIKKSVFNDFVDRCNWPSYPDWAKYSDFHNIGSPKIFWDYINKENKICYSIFNLRNGSSNLVGFLLINQDDDCASFGLIIHPNWLSKGIGGKVILKTLFHCFYFLNVNTVKGCIHRNNKNMLSIVSKITHKFTKLDSDVFEYFINKKDYVRNKRLFEIILKK
ncbi:unnamed protein product [marine sediment metagenome]|uniref:N-acetyltransferase domain-containing protein n=1 Tax=marine sediment metagenome TaxID=412755 RepID=X0WUM7_9ZZZZ